MKFISCLITVLCLSGSLAAQTCNWINKVEGDGNEIITSHCTLSANQSVIAGSFDKQAGITFKSSSAAPFQIKTERTKQNEQVFLTNFFLAKYDADGNLGWALHSKGLNASFAYDVCADREDNIVICGSYKGDLLLPSLDGKEKLLEGSKEIERMAPPGNEYVIYNYFVAKYNSKGNLLWSRTALSNDNLFAQAVKVDQENNIYVKAYCYTNAISIGDITLMSDSKAGLNVSSFPTIFIKYDPAGKEQWVTYGGDVYAKDMQINKEGNLCFLIWLNGQGQLKSSNGSIYRLTEVGYREDAEIELNKDGTVKNVHKLFSQIDHLQVHNYVYDSLGNYYALLETNYYVKGDIIIGDKTIPVTETDPADGDVFLVKFTPDHKPLWYAAMHGEYIDNAFDLVLDQDQDPIAAGVYSYETLVTDAFHKDTILSAKRKSFYIASFSKNGKLKKVENIGLRSYRDLPEYLSITMTPQQQLFVSATVSHAGEVFGHNLEILGKTGFWPNYDTINGTPGIHEYCDSYFTVVSLSNEPDRKDSLAITKKDILKPVNLPVTKIEQQKIISIHDPIAVNSVSLYPNPVTAGNKKINMLIKVNKEETIYIQLLDQNGKQLLSRSEKLMAGNNRSDIYLTGYAAGLYYMKFIFKSGAETKKIILL